MRKSFLSTAVLLCLAGCGSQGQKSPSVSAGTAGIPLTEFGGLYDWRADGSAGIYVESSDRKWFYATFLGQCQNLPFTEHVDIHTVPGQALTEFDSIEVRGEDCYFKTVEPVSGPPGFKPAKP